MNIAEQNPIVDAIRTTIIPRAEDLPYWTSPPIQFVYESTAALALGRYTWADVPTALTPNRPILNNSLYYFRSVSLTADVAELDFTSNILTRPQYFMFLRGDSYAPFFREPIEFNKFYDQFEYRYFWMSHQGENDQLFAAFRGVVNQGPGLIGKNSVTLKAIISAQEINDDNFIQLFKSTYPAVSGSIREGRNV